MQITIWNHSGDHANYYPACNYWKYCPALWSWAFPEGDVENYWSVTGCHLKSPALCSWEQQSYPGTTWASIEENHIKQKSYPSALLLEVEEFSLAVQNHGGADQANWMPCRCPHGPRAFSSSWIHQDRWLTPDHRRCRRMFAHRHRNWDRQGSSHVLCADASIVSLYNCYGHARVFRRVFERLVDCYIKETDGIRRNGDQSGRGWPWTHHRISDETSADGSSLSACLPTCVGGSDDDESVWGIGLDVLIGIQPLQNVLRPCGQRQGVQFAWSLHPDSGQLNKMNSPLSFRFEVRRRTWSSFDPIVLNRSPHSPWLRLLSGKTAELVGWFHTIGEQCRWYWNRLKVIFGTRTLLKTPWENVDWETDLENLNVQRLAEQYPGYLVAEFLWC